jgi:hypothetical protein
MSGTLDGRAVENDAKRVGAQFERVTDVTIDGASHDFWFLRPPPLVPEITDAFLRGERGMSESLGRSCFDGWPEPGLAPTYVGAGSLVETTS